MSNIKKLKKKVLILSPVFILSLGILSLDKEIKRVCAASGRMGRKTPSPIRSKSPEYRIVPSLQSKLKQELTDGVKFEETLQTFKVVMDKTHPRRGEKPNLDLDKLVSKTQDKEGEQSSQQIKLKDVLSQTKDRAKSKLARFTRQEFEELEKSILETSGKKVRISYDKEGETVKVQQLREDSEVLVETNVDLPSTSKKKSKSKKKPRASTSEQYLDLSNQGADGFNVVGDEESLIRDRGEQASDNSKEYLERGARPKQRRQSKLEPDQTRVYPEKGENNIYRFPFKKTPVSYFKVLKSMLADHRLQSIKEDIKLLPPDQVMKSLFFNKDIKKYEVDDVKVKEYVNNLTFDYKLARSSEISKIKENLQKILVVESDDIKDIEIDFIRKYILSTGEFSEDVLNLISDIEIVKLLKNSNVELDIGVFDKELFLKNMQPFIEKPIGIPPVPKDKGYKYIERRNGKFYVDGLKGRNYDYYKALGEIELEISNIIEIYGVNSLKYKTAKYLTPDEAMSCIYYDNKSRGFRIDALKLQQIFQNIDEDDYRQRVTKVIADQKFLKDLKEVEVPSEKNIKEFREFVLYIGIMDSYELESMPDKEIINLAKEIIKEVGKNYILNIDFYR